MEHNFLLETPLGPDMLIVQSFSGTEEMSCLYSYVIEAKSKIATLSFEDIVGRHVTLIIWSADGVKRFISGNVRRFSQPGRLDDLHRYHLEIVPWLWFLTQRADCRIFQEKTVLDIIKAVFDGAGFSGKYEVKTTATYRTREYCVQYRETDFHFVSRLMEEEGIGYFFTHDKGEHKLVLVDAPGAHQPIKPAGTVVYCRSSEVDQRQQSVIDFTADQSVQSTKISLRDFDFTKPSTDLTVMKQTTADYELYDFPGSYSERPHGEHYVKVRLEREQAGCKVFSGTSTDYRLAAGSTFKLIEHPRAQYNASYLLTSVTFSGSQIEDASHINCSFACIPADVPFRPQCRTVKPVISGCQTAIVVGPSGEEIWLDKYGRIKVQFHWDRLGAHDENSSCWIRVGREWAGKNWGFVFHPRIGQEVIIQFIEGDVDRPIVTGSVYNEEQMPPYGLPANSTQSTIKSRSSKGGAPDNCNEIRFEDKTGSEHFLIHAEKDHMVEVENDETNWVGANRNSTIDKDDMLHIKGNETVTVDGNRTEHVLKDETITIDGNRIETVQKDETITINGNRTETVDKDETITINGNRTETVQKDETITINGQRTETVQKDETITINGQRTETVEKDETITINGQRTETVQKDETITINGQRTETVQKDETITINGQRTETVQKDETVTINGQRTETVQKDETITINGQRTETVVKDETITVNGQRTLNVDKNSATTVAKDETRTINQNLTETVMKNATISVNENRTTTIAKTDNLTVNKEWLVNVTDKVEITCGSASITLKSDGTVLINGNNIRTTASGRYDISATGDVKVEGKKVALN